MPSESPGVLSLRCVFGEEDRARDDVAEKTGKAGDDRAEKDFFPEQPGDADATECQGIIQNGLSGMHDVSSEEELYQTGHCAGGDSPLEAVPIGEKEKGRHFERNGTALRHPKQFEIRQHHGKSDAKRTFDQELHSLRTVSCPCFVHTKTP